MRAQTGRRPQVHPEGTGYRSWMCDSVSVSVRVLYLLTFCKHMYGQENAHSTVLCAVGLVSQVSGKG